jgi:5-formyltetrahydrofolate cyclo-ligase
MRQRCLEVGAVSAQQAAEAVARHLAASAVYRKARRIVLYAELPGEVPVAPLAARAEADGLARLWPRQRADGALEVVACAGVQELAPGPHGVREPGPEREPAGLGAGDLLVVPGLAFDAEGGRLGRGGGAWDRTLADVAGAVAVGIGYEFQVVARVPREAHDRSLAALVTECGFRRSQPT